MEEKVILVENIHGNTELPAKANDYAAGYDGKVIVEEAIDAREFECAVMGNEEIMVSGVGEVLSAAEFYDYDAKYNNSESRTVIPAPIEEEQAEEMRRIAKKIFRAVDGAGLARVDFFIDRKTGKVLFNELNTMPGFTSISMYPMLWEAAGMSNSEMVDRVIELALSRDTGIRG